MWELVFSVFLANLGSDDYRQREAAHAALQQLAPLAVERLCIAESSADREVATRTRRILNKYYDDNAPRWADETLPTQYGQLPWIGELPAEYAEGLGQVYLQRARRQVGMQGPPEWRDYRLATRMLVEDLYSRRVPRQRIILILDQLAEAERVWVSNHGQRFDPPITVTTIKK
jgi:hypothetical protein